MFFAAWKIALKIVNILISPKKINRWFIKEMITKMKCCLFYQIVDLCYPLKSKIAELKKCLKKAVKVHQNDLKWGKPIKELVNHFKPARTWKPFHVFMVSRYTIIIPTAPRQLSFVAYRWPFAI